MNTTVTSLNDKDFEIFLEEINRVYLPLHKNQKILYEIYRRLVSNFDNIAPDKTLSYLIYQFAEYAKRIILAGAGQEGDSSVKNEVIDRIASLLDEKSKMRKGDQLLLVSTLLNEDEEGNIIFKKNNETESKIFSDESLGKCIRKLFDHFKSEYDYGSMYEREDISLLNFILFNNIVSESSQEQENDLNKKIRLQLRIRFRYFPISFIKSILKSFVEFSYIENNRLPLLVSMKMAFVRYFDPIDFINTAQVLPDIERLMSEDQEVSAIVKTYSNLNEAQKEKLRVRVRELREAKSERSLREVLNGFGLIS